MGRLTTLRCCWGCGCTPTVWASGPAARSRSVSSRRGVLAANSTGSRDIARFRAEHQDAIAGLFGQVLAGHLEAFRILGGVPTVHVRYDNLKSAVSRVLFGRNRVESDRWVSFRSHHNFDAFYCQPGIGGAHEKGGVEGEGGRFRRTHLVPVPKVATLAELNARLEGYDEADDARRIANRISTVGQDFAREVRLLRPLPAERFEAGLVLTPRVDRHARVTVRQCHYSVPARLIGQRVRVLLRADQLIISSGRTEVARHERSTVRGSATLTLDHYLEVLVRKPGAMPGATALVQARKAGTFTAAHEAFWVAARKAHGDSDGTRELVEVLLLHRHLHTVDIVDGLCAALGVGAARADVVAVEARRLADQRGNAPLPTAAQEPPARVVSLTQRRLADPAAVIAGLPPDQRPMPSVAGYDELLTRRGPTRPAAATSTKGAVS